MKKFIVTYIVTNMLDDTFITVNVIDRDTKSSVYVKNVTDKIFNDVNDARIAILASGITVDYSSYNFGNTKISLSSMVR
jgi:hypothetical protein